MLLVDTLISARWILPIIPANQLLEYYSLAITNGRISAILPTSAIKDQIEAKHYVDLQDHILMPGLVNAHTHSPMTLFRGLADDLALMDWLNNHIWPAEKHWLGEEFVKDGTELAILEMLRSGTTCFNENYFFADTIAQVTAD